MESAADLRDHLGRQERGSPARFLRRETVRQAIEKTTRKHVAGAGQILGFAGKSGYMYLGSVVSNIRSAWPGRHYRRRHMAPQLAKRFVRGRRLGHRTGFRLVAKKQIGLHQSFVKWPIEKVDDEGLGTGQGYFRSPFLRNADGRADGRLTAGLANK